MKSSPSFLFWGKTPTKSLRHKDLFSIFASKKRHGLVSLFGSENNEKFAMQPG